MVWNGMKWNTVTIHIIFYSILLHQIQACQSFQAVFTDAVMQHMMVIFGLQGHYSLMTGS